MGIEERISELEELTVKLSDKVTYLESVNRDKWVSAKELAELMGCSTNNIYIKIRSGEIYATNKLGSIPRIPMSQFYKNETANIDIKKKDNSKNLNLTMRERVFGAT